MFYVTVLFFALFAIVSATAFYSGYIKRKRELEYVSGSQNVVQTAPERCAYRIPPSSTGGNITSGLILAEET